MEKRLRDTELLVWRSGEKWVHLALASCSVQKVLEIVRYKYRLRPGAVAERTLVAEWHRCRFLWNEAVHQQRTGARPTRSKLGKLLTLARAKSLWLREGSQNCQAEMINNYARSLERSFTVRATGRPAFKKRRGTFPSLGYTRNGFTLAGGRLRLAKGAVIPVVWSRELPSEPTSVQVYQDSLGHWYASFVVRRELVPAPPAAASIGVDWGVKTTATTTDPAYDSVFEGYRDRAAKELAQAQRRMARRRRPRGQSPSNGYERARRSAALVQKKAQRQNVHTARVWARRVVDNHQTIAIEDLKPQFLSRSTMARKAADAAIGATKREVVERGVRAGRRVVLVPPAYTTMTCGDCGARAKARLLLSQRIFRCEECGHSADCDRNAARVILDVAEWGRAGADGVRHPLPSLMVGRPVLPEPEIHLV